MGIVTDESETVGEEDLPQLQADQASWGRSRAVLQPEAQAAAGL